MGEFPKTFLGALFHPWAWRMAWRDSRSQRGRLALYALSIAAGICALTAIHSLKSSVQEAINTQSKSLLGADVLISSRRPVPETRLATVAHLIKETARETAFSTMLSVPSTKRTRLVQVRALEGPYPFGNQVETQPPGIWEKLQDRSGILLEPSLMVELGVHANDTLKLGALELTVLGSVSKGVPRSNRFSGFAPEVFISRADIEATGLAGLQSLVYHHVAIELRAINEAERKDAVGEIQKNFSENGVQQNGVQLQTPENRTEAAGEGLEKAKEFLGITALAALALGGIGVAGAIHTHIRRRLPTVAVLLCLGCPTQAAFAVYLIQAGVLGMLGALLGVFSGSIAHALAVDFAASSLPVTVSALPPLLILCKTAATGFFLCCGFALLPLLRIQDISPAATLSGRPLVRAKTPLREIAVYVFLALLVWAVARFNGSTSLRAVGLSVGLLAAFSTLAATAWALMHLARRLLRPSWPYVLRQGVSNLFRPQNQTLLFLLSLGLSVFLLLSTWLTQKLVLGQLTLDPGGTSPNLYVIDVQPDQTSTITRLLEEQNLPLLEDSPMVTMRIESVKGLPLSAIEPLLNAAANSGKPHAQRVPRWVMEREYRSTYRATLNASETIVAGTWPPQEIAPGEPVPLSLEQKLAKDLHLELGDEIVLDVQGVLLKARVTCLRRVDWSKFNLNFFMVFPPGVLEQAPQFHLLTTRVPNENSSGSLQNALLQAAPNVSAVDLTSVLSTVAEQLQKAARVIQLLAGFTLAAGLPILIAALLNGKDQRIRESVLLRTLGASERQVHTIILVEYAALGLLSGLAACLLALCAQWAEARWIFKTNAALELQPFLVALGLTLGSALASGSVLSRGVCSHSPLSILRQG